MDASTLRFLAHVGSFSLAIALCALQLVAKGRCLDGRYYRLGSTALILYSMWFLLLSASLRDAGMLKRSEIVWLLGATEMAAAIGGWAWLVLTVKISFNFIRHKHKAIDASDRFQTQ